jgi:hypothetical protein
MKQKLSVFKSTFWDFFLQKCLRNLASVKYQWLLFLYIPTIWGMFNLNPKTEQPWISAALGLGFLGGGFITLATSRIIAKSKLTEDDDVESINTDK